MPYMKQQLKALNAHLVSTGQLHANNPLRDAVKIKRIAKNMKDAFDSQFFTSLLVPDTEQLRRVYTMELYASED